MFRNRIKQIIIVTYSLILCNVENGFSQVDNYAKNVKLSTDAKTIYEQELKDNPNSAIPHWNYANTKARFKHNAYKDAWKYYLKAIDIDSTNVNIYIDFGDFIKNRLNDIENAQLIYESALQIDEGNKDLKQRIQETKSLLNKPQSEVVFTRELKEDKDKLSYDKITDFERLNNEVVNKESSYYYPRQLKKFNKGQKLSNYEMYLLLIGYTQTDDYNPYNYSQIDELYAMVESKAYDKAIKFGENLLKSNPLNPAIFAELIYSYQQLGQEEKVKYYKKKRSSVFEAMLYSGTGSKEEPYVTIWVKEEYTLVKYLGLKSTGQVSFNLETEMATDKMEVINTHSKQKGYIYFNVTPIFNSVQKKLKNMD